MTATRAVHVDGLVPGDAAAILDGAVVVDAHGTVIDFGRASDVLPRHAGLAVERLRGVLLPGLVNAHTHLELSALRGKVSGGAGFVAWAERLVGARTEAQPEEDAIAIDRAVADLDAFCTSAVGEVTNSLAAVQALARCGIAGCVFHEVFGVERSAVQRRVKDLPRAVQEVASPWPSADLAYSVTPHTLYTTHPSMVEQLFREGRARNLRLSLHLAEHAAERRFLEHGDGPVMDWYERRLKLSRATVSFPHKSPVEWAAELGALSPNVVLVHLTDARLDEIKLVAERGSPVVFCPRSNLHIEARLPPLPAVVAAGILPALGTDSLASSPTLDVLADARALSERFAGVPAGTLIRMATWEGARALGRPDLGRIALGTRPGLFVVEGDRSPGEDPCAFVLSKPRAPRRWVIRRRPGGTPAAAAPPSGESLQAVS